MQVYACVSMPCNLQGSFKSQPTATSLAHDASPGAPLTYYGTFQILDRICMLPMLSLTSRSGSGPSGPTHSLVSAVMAPGCPATLRARASTTSRVASSSSSMSATPGPGGKEGEEGVWEYEGMCVGVFRRVCACGCEPKQAGTQAHTQLWVHVGMRFLGVMSRPGQNKSWILPMHYIQSFASAW